MPTIVPAWSGMEEFSDYCVNVDFTVGASNHGYHEGEWAYIDVDDLAEKMIWVYENYAAVAEEAYEAGLKLRKDFSWDDIVSKMLTRLEPHW
jgi:hypothetical protein